MIRAFLGILLLLICALLTGCISLDRSRMEDDGEDKPWNEPAGWESTLPGMGQ